MTKLNAVIVEDEIRSRETLSGLLKLYCKNVKIVAEADGVASGVKAIEKYSPDVVFLDIQMPDGSGFKLLEKLDNYNFDVIFTTAYDQFAIKAIKFSALDYLLKPIFPDDLIAAVKKAEDRKQQKNIKTNVDVLIESVRQPENPDPKIVLSTSEDIFVVKVKDIVHCESSNYYTFFYLIDGKEIIVSRTLKETEELLSSYHFLRVHKSHLVNLNYVQNFTRHEGGKIILTNGSKIPVSRRKREKVLEIISNL